MTEEQISALLRLKRYEQPPKGYFDRLLKDIHRKQRSELLRRSLWQIAFERVQTLFGSHSMGSVTYAGAMACLLITGFVAIGLLTPSELQPEAGLQASAKTAMPEESNYISLQQKTPSFLPAMQAMPVLQPVVNQSQKWRAPRYIIDALPASYEQSSDF